MLVSYPLSDMRFQPMERVGDPSVVSALLSLVVTMRNRLIALGLSQVCGNFS